MLSLGYKDLDRSAISKVQKSVVSCNSDLLIIQNKQFNFPKDYLSLSTWPTRYDSQTRSSAESSDGGWAFFSHAFWSIIMLHSFKAPTRISQGKYVRTSWSGLFWEQCNSNGTWLQCWAAYHPVSSLMNVNQRHIFTAAQTTKCILVRQCN